MNAEKLKSMLEMQDKLNRTINPLWIESRYPWHRAIMVEAVEALDHYGWKWWKAETEPDVDQISLELVDIWHFAMSLILEGQNGDIDATVKLITDYFGALEVDPDIYGEISTVQTPQLFDLLAGSAGIQRQLNGPAFNTLMKRLNLTWDRIYVLYMGKNVLNMFRQANGYKEGSYVKMWHGKEDNVVLSGILMAKPSSTPTELMDALYEIYEAL